MLVLDGVRTSKTSNILPMDGTKIYELNDYKKYGFGKYQFSSKMDMNIL